jgi:hypothetical protein
MQPQSQSINDYYSSLEYQTWIDLAHKRKEERDKGYWVQRISYHVPFSICDGIPKMQFVFACHVINFPKNLSINLHSISANGIFQNMAYSNHKNY